MSMTIKQLKELVASIPEHHDKERVYMQFPDVTLRSDVIVDVDQLYRAEWQDGTETLVFKSYTSLHDTPVGVELVGDGDSHPKVEACLRLYPE